MCWTGRRPVFPLAGGGADGGVLLCNVLLLASPFALCGAAGVGEGEGEEGDTDGHGLTGTGTDVEDGIFSLRLLNENGAGPKGVVDEAVGMWQVARGSWHVEEVFRMGF
jgi:hypothetical protein